MKHFFGLRDFYNLIRTLTDLIKEKKDKNQLDNIIDECCDKAIYRNFSGLSKGYEQFKNKYFGIVNRKVP
jgi:hypothetical protein